MSAGTEKKQFGLEYDHEIQSRNPIKYLIMTKQTVCNRPLQIFASLYLYMYLAWCLWFIIEESGAILVLWVFVGLKRGFAFVCNSIV